MSLIDKESSTETAAHLLGRLRSAAIDVEVETGRNTSTSIAYSAHGLILRQKESVRTTEYRGLTKEAACLLEDLDADGTTTTVYYKAISESGEYAAVAITTGSKTDYVPSRADEGDAWQVVKTETTYSAASATGWTTTRPSAASSTGIIVSEDASKQFLAAGVLGAKVYQNEETVVREYPFLTYAEAHAKVASQKAAGSRVYDEQIPTSWSTLEGVKAWRNVTVRGGTPTSANRGTDKVPTLRYDGPERGWVVTVTETTYWGSSS